MKKKSTFLEKVIFTVVIVLSLMAYFDNSTRQDLLLGSAFLLFAAYQISKVSRFYKDANSIINIIWIISIIVVLLGAALSFFNWGWSAIAALGIFLFYFTWQYSFLANKPEIK